MRVSRGSGLLPKEPGVAFLVAVGDADQPCPIGGMGDVADHSPVLRRRKGEPGHFAFPKDINPGGMELVALRLKEVQQIEGRTPAAQGHGVEVVPRKEGPACLQVQDQAQPTEVLIEQIALLLQPEAAHHHAELVEGVLPGENSGDLHRRGDHLLGQGQLGPLLPGPLVTVQIQLGASLRQMQTKQGKAVFVGADRPQGIGSGAARREGQQLSQGLVGGIEGIDLVAFRLGHLMADDQKPAVRRGHGRIGEAAVRDPVFRRGPSGTVEAQEPQGIRFLVEGIAGERQSVNGAVQLRAGVDRLVALILQRQQGDVLRDGGVDPVVNCRTRERFAELKAAVEHTVFRDRAKAAGVGRRGAAAVLRQELHGMLRPGVDWGGSAGLRRGLAPTAACREEQQGNQEKDDRFFAHKDSPPACHRSLSTL